MKIIDTNAYLGHWATRCLRHNTPDGLLRLMDRAGIEQACVSSASAIMYRNPHSGNEELAEMIEGHRDRLIPFATLSPAYAAWETDLRWCTDVLGARGVRLYPDYHRYKLGDGCCHEFIEAAAGLVLSIPQRVEDYRQRHWLIDAPDVNLNELAAVIGAHPQAKFLVNNALGVGGSALVTQKDTLPDNYWVDICRPDPVYTKEAVALVESLGVERLVFGSGIPFNYPEPATLRLELLPVSDVDKAKIANGNIASLLGLA
jgi:uncharacterized protein